MYALAVVSPLRTVFALPCARVALGIAAAVAVAMCAVPLLGVQGPESALVLGVLLPPMAAYVSARLCLVVRARGGAARIAALLEASTGFSFALVALAAGVLGLDSLRIRNCAPLEGLAFMVLGPGLGTWLAGLCGVVAAVLVVRPLAAVSCATLLPFGGVALALLRFYETPAIFAYSHFFGMFSGTLYDEKIGLQAPLLSLRVASCVWIAGLLLLLVSSVDPRSLRPSRARVRERRAAFALALVACVVAAASLLFATELHQASSRHALREALGGQLDSRRCRLLFPRELARDERLRLADECDFGMARAERFLGVTHPTKAIVYLFRSPAEKRLLMGAASTNIAKPWRSEVYLSDGGFPNPTLGHELVHVVARHIGVGPLRVSGRLWGLLPDMALVEGVAVAAAWTPSAGLTPHQWARAMQQLGLLPRLSSVFGAGFLAQQKRLAYTLSGSVLRFVAERYGARIVRRAYTSGDLASALGISLDALDAKWQSYLRTQPLSPHSLAFARARFSGTSVLSAVCPHVRAALEEQLRADLSAGDDAGASRSCARILDIDPGDDAIRAAWVAALARQRNDAGAQRELAAMAGVGGAKNPWVSVARHALADEAARRGDRSTALFGYEALVHEPVDDDALRQLQVKVLGQHGSDKQAALLFELLVGEPGLRADPATAVHLARELRAERTDGLPHYLEARQLYFQRRYARAATLLGESRSLGLPTPELRTEGLRVEAICRFAIADFDGSAALFRRFSADAVPGRVAEANDWLAHIEFTRRARPPAGAP